MKKITNMKKMHFFNAFHLIQLGRGNLTKIIKIKINVF